MDHGMVRCSWLGMAFQFTIWLIERVQYHILWISDKQCLNLCHTISFTLAYDVRVAEFPTLFISCCVDHGTAEIDAALILRLGVAFLLPQVHNMRQYNITNTNGHTISSTVFTQWSALFMLYRPLLVLPLGRPKTGARSLCMTTHTGLWTHKTHTTSPRNRWLVYNTTGECTVGEVSWLLSIKLLSKSLLTCL